MSPWLFIVAALAAAPGPAQQAAPLHAYVADRASRLYVVTHKTGLLSFLGHDHAILPSEWHGDFCLADPIPGNAHASLVVPTRTLVIDSDSARTLAGMGGGPGPDERRQIQHKMLDAQHLDAARFPDVTLELQAIAPPADGRLDVRGTLRLHGVTRSVTFPITVRHDPDGRLVLSGTLRIGQRDYGIKPESVAGVVKVANDVDLHFLLSLRPTGQPCSPSGP